MQAMTNLSKQSLRNYFHFVSSSFSHC